MPLTYAERLILSKRLEDNILATIVFTVNQAGPGPYTCNADGSLYTTDTMSVRILGIACYRDMNVAAAMYFALHVDYPMWSLSKPAAFQPLVEC